MSFQNVPLSLVMFLVNEGHSVTHLAAQELVQTVRSPFKGWIVDALNDPT